MDGIDTNKSTFITFNQFNWWDFIKINETETFYSVEKKISGD